MAEERYQCGESFASAAALIEHARSAHHGAEPEIPMRAPIDRFRCLLCGERFPTSEALARHAGKPHAPVRRSRGTPRPV